MSQSFVRKEHDKKQRRDPITFNNLVSQTGHTYTHGEVTIGADPALPQAIGGTIQGGLHTQSAAAPVTAGVDGSAMADSMVDVFHMSDPVLETEDKEILQSGNAVFGEDLPVGEANLIGETRAQSVTRSVLREIVFRPPAKSTTGRQLSKPVPVARTRQESSIALYSYGSTPVQIPPVETSQVETSPVEIPASNRTRTPKREERNVSGVITVAPTSPPEAIPQSLSHVKKRLYKPIRAADAHTDGEDRLYRFMWSKGKEVSKAVRAIAVSVSTLGRVLRRDDRNTRPLINALIRKLSISIAREQDFRKGTPRVYYIYDYAEIQKRRVAKGLEWALKNKGIQLVTETEARQLKGAPSEDGFNQGGHGMRDVSR